MRSENHEEKSTTHAEFDIDGRYTVLSRVTWWPGKSPSHVGTAGRCRYCGTNDRGQFRNKAHLFPEFLGNKNVFSLDECDACNSTFSQYETELAHRLQPLLALGGIRGKRSVPTLKDASMRFERSGGSENWISIRVDGKSVDEIVGVDTVNRRLTLRTPLPKARYIPRNAYKALVKMAVAMLPEEELPHYSKLIEWLRDPIESLEFPCLEVVSSYAQVGHPLQLVDGVLLRRVDPTDDVPHILFVLVAGALCFQIDLMSDNMEDEEVPQLMGNIAIRWTVHLSDGRGSEPIRVDYSGHKPENWTAGSLVERELSEFVFNITMS